MHRGTASALTKMIEPARLARLRGKAPQTLDLGRLPARAREAGDSLDRQRPELDNRSMKNVDRRNLAFGSSNVRVARGLAVEPMKTANDQGS